MLNKQRLVWTLTHLKNNHGTMKPGSGICYFVRKVLGIPYVELLNQCFEELGHCSTYPIKGDGTRPPYKVYLNTPDEELWSGVQLKQRLALIDEVVDLLKSKLSAESAQVNSTY